MSFLGCVLTGGASSRMGTDKALLPVDGIPMAKRVAEALAEGGATFVICVGGDTDALEAIGLEPIPDDHPGEGPLGGVLTALEFADWVWQPNLVVSACDHPWLDAEAVEDLAFGLTQAPLAQPASDLDRPPLFLAARVQEALPIVRELFAGGERSMRQLGAHLPVSTVHTISPDATRDVDEPGDLP